jgi:hypothetical protein
LDVGGAPPPGLEERGFWHAFRRPKGFGMAEFHFSGFCARIAPLLIVRLLNSVPSGAF